MASMDEINSIFGKRISKKLKLSLLHLNQEYESFPPELGARPTPQGVRLKIVRQLRLAGIQEEKGSRGPLSKLINKEAAIRWQAIISHFGETKGVNYPFVVGELNRMAGRNQPKRPEAKRGNKKQVNEFLVELSHRLNDSERFSKFTDQELAEEFFKKTGRTTTRQTVSKCPFRVNMRLETQKEKEGRAREFRARKT